MTSKNYFVEPISKDRVHYHELQGSKLKILLRSPFGNQLYGLPDANWPVCMIFTAVPEPRNKGNSTESREIQIHVDTTYLQL